MDRHYLLPIAIATGVHSLIFLGNGPAHPPPPHPPTIVVSPWDPPPMPPLDVEAPESESGEGIKSAETPPPPSGAERLTPIRDAGDFIQKPDYESLLPRINGEIGSIAPDWPTHKGGTGPGGKPEFTRDLLDNNPAARFQPAPLYPQDLKPTGMEGQVTVMFSVDVNGEVFNASVSRTNHTRFGEEALRAVRRWRFEPGIKDGRRVPFRMVQTFSFTLQS